MKTNQKLLLDDLIETVLHLNEKDPAFGGILKITPSGVSLSTHNNMWGMHTIWANSEEDLKGMVLWVNNQYQVFLKQRTSKAWTYQEPKEEIRDLEDDLKRGVK